MSSPVTAPRPRRRGVVASPLLIGTVTLLVTLVAFVFSYNANTGLPFVPTYDVSVRLPDAAGLMRGNEVRVGGKRVGIVSSLEAQDTGDGKPVALAQLQLQQKAGPLRDDSRVTVRPRSPLGLKYLELVPGRSGRAIPHRGELPADAARGTVELDEVLNAFDRGTREGLQRTTKELGNGLAGRGADLNATIAAGAAFARDLETVAGDLSARETDLRRLLRGADAVTGELAPVAGDLGELVESSSTTAGALAEARKELEAAVAELPASEEAGISALSASRPVLADAAALARDARAGTRRLPRAAARLHAALDTGTPVLGRATALADRLEETLGAVLDLSRDPATPDTLRRLRAAVRSLAPTVEFLAPFQVRCNYLGLWTRNVNSTISEGDDAGTWFRTLTVVQPDEMLARATPAPNLHVNPYGHTGQSGECEVGNEPFLDGQRIGHTPGREPGATELTSPPPGVGKP